ncbi:MAG: DUF4238 domain-containing protein [Candidatus Electrothrix sp. AUS4]|nr:DUF4238 domain-containing protein [Candidatus Electrothrix sp. AUS4]
MFTKLFLLNYAISAFEGYSGIAAQRLRTPKGLAWLIKILQPRSYNELLIRMQEVRRMHCAMWIEASMEIVTANNSKTKFIVSDNPVTLYNQNFYPKCKRCLFPYDPGIELKGTRTIFPLDLEHCAILTNLEYARSPGRYKASKTRTNARYFDNTLCMYDDIIRERDFNEQQVLTVNYILKSRAQQFIAAAKKDWLYPEKYLKKRDWRNFDKTFVSKSVKLLGRDGEIFIGGEDGNLLAYQDEFGRKPNSRKEWEEKKRHAQDIYNRVIKKLQKDSI